MTLVLRPATAEDCDLLLWWRNDPAAVANFFAGRGVTLDEHRTWLAGALADPNVKIYVALDGETPVGTGRLNRQADGLVEFSITIDEPYRGRGYGKALISALTQEIRRWWTSDRARAVIKPTNIASIRAFAACGFKFVNFDRDRVVLEFQVWRTPALPDDPETDFIAERIPACSP